MSDRFRQSKWPIYICLVIVLVACGIYVRSTAVPFRQFDLKFIHGFHRLGADERLNHLIKRAKWDFLIDPVAGRGDELQFFQAYQKDNEVQIVFRRANSSGVIVIYSFSLHDGKPLWKSEAPFPLD